MGMNDHTKIPQPYQAENNLWLVDFPGGNSIEDYCDYWQDFSALPSFVVLLLPFEVHTISLLDTKYIITAYSFASLIPAVEGLWGMHKEKLTLDFSANMDQVRFHLKVIFGLYILTYGKNAALT